jgi:NADP-dependent 3-hydroxy acid dehydrogenase YdfG
MKRIICTGNEKNQTIAWAVRRKWPQSTLMSLSGGWNLTFPDISDRHRFCQEITNCNVFINASFIAPNVQSVLLETVVNEWMRENIRGHIISLGTTLEWEFDSDNNSYIESKLSLRNLSLEYNQQTGITGVKSTYLILGGVNNGQPENKDYVDPNRVVDVIDWVLEIPERVGLIQLDGVK